MFRMIIYTIILLMVDVLTYGTIVFSILSIIKTIEGNNTWDFLHWLAGLCIYFIFDGLRAKVEEVWTSTKEVLKV